jgi:hypothetical protein
MDRSAEYQAPAVESFDEVEIIGDSPEAAGTHVPAGSVVPIHGA